MYKRQAISTNQASLPKEVAQYNLTAAQFADKKVSSFLQNKIELACNYELSDGTVGCILVSEPESVIQAGGVIQLQKFLHAHGSKRVEIATVSNLVSRTADFDSRLKVIRDEDTDDVKMDLSITFSGTPKPVLTLSLIHI